MTKHDSKTCPACVADARDSERSKAFQEHVKKMTKNHETELFRLEDNAARAVASVLSDHNVNINKFIRETRYPEDCLPEITLSRSFQPILFAACVHSGLTLKTLHQMMLRLYMQSLFAAALGKADLPADDFRSLEANMPLLVAACFDTFNADYKNMSQLLAQEYDQSCVRFSNAKNPVTAAILEASSRYDQH